MTFCSVSELHAQGKMPISDDSRAALVMLKELQDKVRVTDDLRNNIQVKMILTF